MLQTHDFPRHLPTQPLPQCVASSLKWDEFLKEIPRTLRLSDDRRSEENLDDEPLAWKPEEEAEIVRGAPVEEPEYRLGPRRKMGNEG
ncbi:hypothetical protein HAX54_005011 [Datura stramonium]|uniref:Uncharacterized protein n=1 Tax=Datura stramonium TaxID=4076 RepID=A0ABS8RW98_DATST|nr:hypothetical protein [Datura stramonium]